MRMLITVLAGLTLAAATACAEPAPDKPANPAATAEAGDIQAACAAVMTARKTALDALAPVSATLAQETPSATDLAKATQALRTIFSAMHVDVAAAAEHTSDTRFKEKITAYQFSIEQAIVAVEGADDDKTKLTNAMELPSMRDAEQAIMTACA